MSAFTQGLQFGLLQGMYNNMFGFGGFWGNPFWCFGNFGLMGGGFFNYSPFNFFSMPIFGMPNFMGCSGFYEYPHPQSQLPAIFNSAFSQPQPLFLTGGIFSQQPVSDNRYNSTGNTDTFVSTNSSKTTETTSSAANNTTKTSVQTTSDTKKSSQTSSAGTGSTAPTSPKNNTNRIPANEKVYDELIEKYGKIYGIETDFIRAVIKQESNFKPNAKSPKGAMGLMQLMPDTAKSYGVSDPFNPEQNIEGGVKLLSDLNKRYNGNKEMILAAYNWGTGNLSKYGYEKRPAETREYIKKVMEYYNGYIGA